MQLLLCLTPKPRGRAYGYIDLNPLQVSIFSPSLEECRNAKIFTQMQALTYIGNRVKSPRRGTWTKNAKEVWYGMAWSRL